MDYERAQGREPSDVSAQDLGYDIRSLAPTPAGGGVPRYIEVKARAQSGPIIMTPNEWLMAQRLRQDYWLYVVENASTQPHLYTIPDPAATLTAEERVEVVRYIIKDWKRGTSP